MAKFIVQHAKDEGEFEELCVREYDADLSIPEQGQILEIPGHENDEGELKTYFIENVGRRLTEGEPEYMLLVKDAEQVRREIQQRRKQEMRRMQKMQQQQGGGGGGQGGGQGGGSPFTLG
jgi:hypothetical protein